MKLKRLDTNKKAKGGMVQRRGLSLGQDLRKGVKIFEKGSQSKKSGQNLRKGVKISKKGSKSEEKRVGWFTE